MIRVLPPDIAAQIAAGEVVERPASVIKELVENALDAEASEIVVEIRGGGISEMLIRDNGSGIPADQIETAFMRHATSKLHQAEDLFNIHTLGFRGEALPSIAAVAQVSCTSRTAGAQSGVELRIAGSEIQDKRTVGAPVGTTFLIRNLFYNLPVRREFLRSPGAETTAITAVITHYALAYPHVRFRLLVDGKARIQTSGTGDLADVLLAVHGLDTVQHLLPVAFSQGDGIYHVGIRGYISDPTITRGTREAMHISVNGRAISPRGQLSSIFDDAYHTLLMKGRFPIVVVAITVDPAAVDVNVHPTKSEVKFRDPDYVRSTLADAMRQVLRQHHVIQDWGIAIPPAATDAPAPTKPDQAAERRLSYLADLDRRRTPSTPADSGRTPASRPRETPLFPSETRPSKPVASTPTPPPPPVTAQAAGAAISELIQQQRPSPDARLPELRMIGQLAGLYLLAEGPDHELYIIDQHAAHERINYERLMAQHERGTIRTQPMLIPAMIHFSPSDLAILTSHRDELAHWGFTIAEQDGQIVVHAIPSTVHASRVEAALHQIADHLQGIEGANPQVWQEQMLITLACHTSIRAGQNLSLAEQNALIAQLQECASPRTCPHGRPTIVAMRLELFARQFGRIV